MNALARSLFAADFVIDEKPLPVHEPAVSGASADLLSLTAGLMREQERLTALTEELRQRSAAPAEMEKLMRSILPTLDSFDRVLTVVRSYERSEEIDNWLKTVESIYYRMLSMLENYGLQQLHTAGATVDLNLQEVVEYRRSDDHSPDTVISERQKGYVFRGKLLREAQVVVAYNERS